MAAQVSLLVVLTVAFAVAAIAALFVAPGALNKFWGLCATAGAVGGGMALSHAQALDFDIWEEAFLASAAFGAVFMAVAMATEARASRGQRAHRRRMREHRWRMRQWERDARERQDRDLRMMRRRAEMRKARRKLRA